MRIPMAFVLIFLIIPCVGTTGSADIPPELEHWKQWVLRDHRFLECPVISTGAFESPATHLCGWPGNLKISADTGGASFSLRWLNFTPGWIPLPGDRDMFPQGVLLDGRPVPVVMHGGSPAVDAENGPHKLSGKFLWDHRPEALSVPTDIALIELVVDGRSIFPLQRSGLRLWLGRPEESPAENDTLSIDVYRKLSDGVPAMLESRIVLDVSGQGREEVLGPVLPDSFLPVAISGELPVLMAPDNRIRIQLRPGRWEVRIRARSLHQIGEIQPSWPKEAWPEQEIWAWEASPRLRVADLEGGISIDPSQTSLPDEWSHLPVFTVSPGEKLSVVERSRGMSGQGTTLRLEREIWLDFRGEGMTVRDRIEGRMVTGFRLDAMHPLELKRALSHGRPMMVSSGGKNLTGVELRNPSVDLEASSRLVPTSSKIPVAGWSTPFESVEETLNLPPGRILVAAIGADTSPDAWLSDWTLLDVFLVMITTMLALKLLGVGPSIAVAAFLVLGFHELRPPLFFLLLLLAFSLLKRALSEGRLAVILGTAERVSFLLLVLSILPLTAHQARLALYPQLEQYSIGSVGYSGSDDETFRLLSVAASAPQKQMEEVGDHFSKALPTPKEKMFQRYIATNMVQAGSGEPDWRWRQARMSWEGPVGPDQMLRLLVLSPVMTRLFRILLIALAGLVLWRLILVIKPFELKSGGKKETLFLLLLLFSGITGAGAQTIPSQALLKDLQSELSSPPDCFPDCVTIENSTIRLSGTELRIEMICHAAASAGLPLPGAPKVWKISGIRIDGRPTSIVARTADTENLLPLERGVHHVVISGTIGTAESIDLVFPRAPGRVAIAAPDWDVAGLREHRLLTGVLGLTRRKKKDIRLETRPEEGIKPFVHVERFVELDLDWSIRTRVTRIAPEQAGFSIEIPLIDGEKLLSESLQAGGGGVTVSFPPGVAEKTWTSRLERGENLDLSAGDLVAFSETWLLKVSPQWRVSLSGVPPCLPEEIGEYWVFEFHPLPGETLAIGISRPEAVAGATLAIDSVSLTSAIGSRVREHSLEIDLRCTRGGRHGITIGRDITLLSVQRDDEDLNLRLENGKLILPVHPGTQHYQINWREDLKISSIVRSPEIDLGTEASNLELEISLPGNRWVLGLSGPQVGPAVLYWSELLLMGLLAFLLARFGPQEISMGRWLILGLGFSTFSWGPFVFIVLWLLLIDTRGKLKRKLRWWQFDLYQVFIMWITAAAIFCFVVAVPYGLLASPNMHIEGNASSGHVLRWFSDSTTGPMPGARVLSLPMFTYRIVMLVWALWLAGTLLGWLKWAFSCWSRGGRWKRRPRKKTNTNGKEDRSAEKPVTE